MSTPEQPPPGGDKPQFTVHRVRRGYRTEDVDAFLDELATSIAQGSPAPEIDQAVFASSYGGYDEREVDDFLADLREQLGQG